MKTFNLKFTLIMPIIKKVAVIGNGSWGTTAAKMIAGNILATQEFNPELLLWVHDETYQNQKLSEYINTFKVNPIYLPGIRLPENIRAVTDFEEVQEADVLVIGLPCKFLDTLKGLRPKKEAFAISLSKGLIYHEKKLKTPSEYVSGLLGLECACLCGANIATELAQEHLAECTIGYTKKEQINCLEWMFDSEYFRPKIIPYSSGFEACGALKNIMSLGFGIADGMEWGANTKAMFFRKGLIEMERFCKLLKCKVEILESCCVGDLLASCLGGRNFKCGVEIARKRCLSECVEEKMGGQILEGPETVRVINEWLEANNIEIQKFPIMQAVHRICFLGESPEFLYSALKNSSS